MVEASLPTVSAVLVTAAVDSINPCAIGVALLLVATMLKQGDRKKMLTVGTLYVAAVYLTYLVAGIGFLYFFVNIPVKIANFVTIFVALVVVVGGLFEVKDFFWYGKGSSLMIPEKYAKKISASMEDISVWGYSWRWSSYRAREGRILRF